MVILDHVHERYCLSFVKSLVYVSLETVCQNKLGTSTSSIVDMGACNLLSSDVDLSLLWCKTNVSSLGIVKP